MAWHLFAWQWLIQAAAGGLIVLSVGSLAALICRQPVQRVRLTALAFLGSLLVPWLGALSITPQWSAGFGSAPRPKPTTLSTTSPAPSQATHPIALQPTSILQDRNPADVSLTTRPLPQVRETSPRSTGPSAAGRFWTRVLNAASWQKIAIVAYASISLGFVAWWLIGQYRLLKLSRSARPASMAVRDQFLAISGPRGTKVRLLESDRITLPFTFTWWHPVILLPADLCLDKDTDALKYALAHEWSHVDRGDAWAWTLANIAGFTMFYQPLFWWLRRQLRLCQDYLADNQAAANGSAEDYAAFLVRLARERGAMSTLPALGMGDRRSSLYRRVVMLVQNQEPLEQRCRTVWNLAAVLVATATMMVASGFRLNAAPPEKPEPQSEKKAEAAAASPPKVEGETLHYSGKVKEKGTDKPIAGAKVVVRRSVPRDGGNQVTLQETVHTTDANGSYSFVIPPEQVAEKRLYIELDVEHPDYATQAGFGYALSMIRKNEKLGERPFFENVELRPAKPVIGRVETPEGKPLEGVDLLAYSRSSTPKVGENFEYGSFTRAKTDTNGQFRMPITTPGFGVFWILPKDYAPEMHEIKLDKRGDYGTFVLKNGITVKGQAFDDQGKPLAGLFVQISHERDSELLGQLIVSDAMERRAETDSEGRFTFDPLPPGTFHVQPTDFKPLPNGDFTRKPLPGVFAPQKLILKEGETPEPLEVRATPHVVIEGRWLDSQGKPKGGWDVMISGRIDGQFWHAQAHPSEDGLFSAKVPHGLENAQVMIMTNEHASMRHRIGKKGKLGTSRNIMLDTLDHDVRDLEIIRYVAPIVIAKITDKKGQPATDPALTGEYLEETSDDGMRMIVKNNMRSDISFNKQEDGRFRTSQLVPDRKIKLTAHAKGLKSLSREFRLPEGKTGEVTFELEPE